MTALEIFSEKSFKNISAAKVASFRPCVIYYITTGRNAWHSTWIQRYSKGCMHTTIQSAKRHAEKLRTQGTVFTITEYPALQIITASGHIIITQINTKRPLADYSPDAVRAQPPQGAELIDGARDNYLIEGAIASSVVLSFDCSSRFWRKPPPRKNSLIVTASSDAALKVMILTQRKLQAWSSYSNGSGYLLGWRERENNIKGNKIRALAFCSEN